MLFLVSASPCWLSTKLHLGVGVTRILLPICTVLCSLKWVRCPDHLSPRQGKSPCFIGWVGGGGGIIIIFFFFELVQGFHRCIKICTVLFAFSQFGYRN